MPSTDNYEQLTINRGLGPISSDIDIQIAPLTVLLGPQGTGKSLISQLLYFFRDSHYLIAYQLKTGRSSVDTTVRSVVDNLRSGKRAFASTFMRDGQTVRVGYKNGNSKKQQISIYRNNEIAPIRGFKTQVQEWVENLNQPFATPAPQATAIFFPAERTFYSRFINISPLTLKQDALPITMQVFTDFLLEARNIHQNWMDASEMPVHARNLQTLMVNALGGYATIPQRGRYARNSWHWVLKDGDKEIDIESSSSGQMQTWPLVTVAQALFEEKRTSRPRYLHIEEPETHLYPDAQIAVVQMLAYLVNQGFRLVITTHSLEILYALNNLIVAHREFGNVSLPNTPDPSIRLNPEDVVAYFCEDGGVKNIMEDGQIDEGLLGEALNNLEVEYNHLLTYNLLHKQK